MMRIAQRVNAYWERTCEQRLIKSLIGILLSNVANDSADMTVDISAATTGNPVTINGAQYTSSAFGRNAVVDAAYTVLRRHTWLRVDIEPPIRHFDTESH